MKYFDDCKNTGLAYLLGFDVNVDVNSIDDDAILKHGNESGFIILARRLYKNVQRKLNKVIIDETTDDGFARYGDLVKSLTALTVANGNTWNGLRLAYNRLTDDLLAA